MPMMKHLSLFGILHIITMSNSRMLNNNRDKFNILSLKCESINAKIDQIRLKLAQYKEGGCEFDAICLQETWLSEDSDKSLLCIEDYALVSLGKTCSTRGGLIIYLKENLKYKMLDMSLKSNIWEGQFIEIFEDICVPKKKKYWVISIDHLVTSMKTTDNLLTNLQLYLRSLKDLTVTSSLQEILLLTSLKSMKNQFSMTISMQSRAIVCSQKLRSPLDSRT